MHWIQPCSGFNDILMLWQSFPLVPRYWFRGDEDLPSRCVEVFPVCRDGELLLQGPGHSLSSLPESFPLFCHRSQPVGDIPNSAANLQKPARRERGVSGIRRPEEERVLHGTERRLDLAPLQGGSGRPSLRDRGGLVAGDLQPPLLHPHLQEVPGSAVIVTPGRLEDVRGELKLRGPSQSG